tara:strand:- start:266 stop:1114 length:849 start_codon:yes stop_codon:yes gene_type:complete
MKIGSQIGVPYDRQLFDSNFRILLDKAIAEGITLPDGTQQIAGDLLIRELKVAGVWDKLDVFYVFATNNSALATLNWINPSAHRATLHSSPTFVVKKGFEGDGSSSYLSLNYNPSTPTAPNYTQNSASIGVYTNGDNNVGDGANYGDDAFDFPIALDANTRIRFPHKNTGGNRVNSSGGPNTQLFPSGTAGLIGLQRTSSTNLDALDASGNLNSNGSSARGAGVSTSGSIANATFEIFRYNPGTPQFGQSQAAMAWVGASFTAAEWSAYVTAANKYYTTVTS